MEVSDDGGKQGRLNLGIARSHSAAWEGRAERMKKGAPPQNDAQCPLSLSVLFSRHAGSVAERNRLISFKRAAQDRSNDRSGI